MPNHQTSPLGFRLNRKKVTQKSTNQLTFKNFAQHFSFNNKALLAKITEIEISCQPHFVVMLQHHSREEDISLSMNIYKPCLSIAYSLRIVLLCCCHCQGRYFHFPAFTIKVTTGVGMNSSSHMEGLGTRRYFESTLFI